MFLVNKDKIRESKSQRDTKFHVRERPNLKTAYLEKCSLKYSFNNHEFQQCSENQKSKGDKISYERET
jgi:hypothetical protein